MNTDAMQDRQCGVWTAGEGTSLSKKELANAVLTQTRGRDAGWQLQDDQQ